MMNEHDSSEKYLLSFDDMAEVRDQSNRWKIYLELKRKTFIELFPSRSNIENFSRTIRFSSHFLALCKNLNRDRFL